MSDEAKPPTPPRYRCWWTYREPSGKLAQTAYDGAGSAVLERHEHFICLHFVDEKQFAMFPPDAVIGGWNWLPDGRWTIIKEVT